MVAQFYRGNNENAIGAPARVLMAPSSYAFPAQLNEIISLTTYNINSTYGWVELGITAVPTTIGHGVDVNELRNEQFGRMRTVPTDYNASVSTEFLELTQNTKVLVMMGSAAADTAGGEKRTNFATRDNIPSYRIAVLFQDHLGKIHASVFPFAQWNGDAIQSAIARGDVVRAPVTFAAYADSALIDSVTGKPCFRVDYDQV